MSWLTTLIIPFTIIFAEANIMELPIGLTKEEENKLYIIEQMGRNTDPPPDPVRNIAEFERMQGVLIRYPFGISTSMIKEMAEDVVCFLDNNGLERIMLLAHSMGGKTAMHVALRFPERVS